ncbi:hypothetical protein EYF80_051275 [Liparis tanakae]|uniref:Uncharacterized protein n=1 Tax=Liparis tanakae TaxID=230148 RepID=A0A4Z2FCF4_9TELE|nr:hypothetical protein EYF80_051275 [Liparis tanakae]
MELLQGNFHYCRGSGIYNVYGAAAAQGVRGSSCSPKVLQVKVPMSKALNPQLLPGASLQPTAP